MASRNGNGETCLEELYHARLLADQGIPPCDDTFAEKYPRTWAYFVTTNAGGGKTGEAASLSINVSQGDWCARLRSPAMQGTCEVLCATFEELLPALEAKLALGVRKAFRFYTKKGVKVKEPKKNS